MPCVYERNKTMTMMMTISTSQPFT